MTELTEPDGSSGLPPWTSRRILGHAVLARGRGRLFTLGTISLAVHQTCEALVPVVIGLTIDHAVLPGDGGALLQWLGVLAGLFVVLSFAWRIGARRLVRVVTIGSHDLRMLATARVLDPHRPAPRRPSGEVLSITSSEADRVAEISWVFAQTAAVTAGLATATFALLAMSIPLGLAVLVSAPIVLLAMHRLARPLEERSETEQEQAAAAGALATDLLQGVRVLKGIGAEAAAADRYRSVSRSSVGAALRAARAKAGYDGLGEVLSDVVLAGIALTAAIMALNGHLQVGELVTVVGLAQFIRGPMTALGHVGVSIAQQRASGGRVADLLNDTPTWPAPGGSAASGSASAGSVASGTAAVVSTAMPVPGRPGDPAALTVALPDGTGDRPKALAIRAGEIVGLVSGNPAAVGSMLAALGGHSRAERGQIVVQGADLADLPAQQIRRLIFVADRDAALFSGSLAENLTAGSDGGVDDRQVRAAAVDDVLTHLPSGLATRLAEQGRNLSGGQRQRVLLARALHRGHPVLVLHEPTTAVDSVTQARIGAALRGRADTAILLITSSPALLATCDRVVKAGSGRWTVGTHADLVVSDATYRDWVRV